MTTDGAWWRDAVVYQVYLRSFADADGDGIGDLAGLRSRLDHLSSLGVDALWLNPCYPSPQLDHGYDIADYFGVEPAYGTVEDLEALVAEAGSRGIRVLLDLVANHCSAEHPWFREALAAPPGSAARRRFHFADGRGRAGAEPPNNWRSVFGGSAWSRVTEPDGRPGQWYLHSFDPGQPDVNWADDDVVRHFDDVLRFWFARGVAGFRIDVAHGMAKTPGLPDLVAGADDHPGWDQPGVHDIYRRWRHIGDGAEPGPRYFVGEIWVSRTTSLRRYLADDELHQAFGFDLLVQPWDAAAQRGAIERTLEAFGPGRLPAWTLSNHDVHRTVTRYGQRQVLDPPDPQDLLGAARRRGPVDEDLGVRRAAAGLMLELALPGSVYLYQGEELGLPEVQDLPDDVRQDPVWRRSGGGEVGRDGCRVPLPWDASAPSFGFSATADPAAPWLPQPGWFGRFAASEQDGDPASLLTLTRRAVRLRRELFAAGAPLEWLDGQPSGVLGLRRGDAICLVNYGDAAASPVVPAGSALVLASSPELAGSSRPAAGAWLPRDSAAWLRVPREA